MYIVNSVHNAYMILQYWSTDYYSDYYNMHNAYIYTDNKCIGTLNVHIPLNRWEMLHNKNTYLIINDVRPHNNQNIQYYNQCDDQPGKTSQ